MNNKLIKLLAKAGINELNFTEKDIEGRIFEKLAAFLDKNGFDAGMLLKLYSEEEFDDGTSIWTPHFDIDVVTWEDFINHLEGTKMINQKLLLFKETQTVNHNSKQKVEQILNSVGITEQDFFLKEIPMQKFEKLAALLDRYGFDAGHLIQMYEENEDKGTWKPKWKIWHLDWNEYLEAISGLMPSIR